MLVQNIAAQSFSDLAVVKPSLTVQVTNVHYSKKSKKVEKRMKHMNKKSSPKSPKVGGMDHHTPLMKKSQKSDQSHSMKPSKSSIEKSEKKQHSTKSAMEMISKKSNMSKGGSYKMHMGMMNGGKGIETLSPSPTVTPYPTNSPYPTITAQPTTTLSPGRTDSPTTQNTPEPSLSPTTQITPEPSLSPTSSPVTEEPTLSPISPTVEPTLVEETLAPTTLAPTQEPSTAPTVTPPLFCFDVDEACGPGNWPDLDIDNNQCGGSRNSPITLTSTTTCEPVDYVFEVRTYTILKCSSHRENIIFVHRYRYKFQSKSSFYFILQGGTCTFGELEYIINEYKVSAIYPTSCIPPTVLVGDLLYEVESWNFALGTGHSLDGSPTFGGVEIVVSFTRC
jgi:hypothetical protein